MQTVMLFIQTNIAYILIVVAVIYLLFFVLGIINSRKADKTHRFKVKYLIAFILILGFAIYCLVTGQDIRTFIY